MESYDILYSIQEKGVGFCMNGKKEIINTLFIVSSSRHIWFIQVKLPNRSEVPRLSGFTHQQNFQINMRNQFKTANSFFC